MISPKKSRRKELRLFTRMLISQRIEASKSQYSFRIMIARRKNTTHESPAKNESQKGKTYSNKDLHSVALNFPSLKLRG